MSTQSPLQLTRKPEDEGPKPRPARQSERPGLPPSAARLTDLGLLGLFLALTFLLGVFPLKDVDFYWHLKTGDLIRQTGQVPHTDIFTFTRQGEPWIDLHWIYQVAISWIYETGGSGQEGIRALNLAKCVVTCLAVLLLVTARRRDWPIWVILLTWLPPLLLLGGRMYVRPETLTLLYLAIFLAVVTRWERYPALALVLPLVQVAWVNSQGLFVLGPIILVCALIDSVLRRGALGPERRRWWLMIGIASVATMAACLVNPYGITGALYPMQLAATMSSPIFSKHIAELMPIPTFIREAGLRNLPLQLHLLTMAVGALSFVVPLGWVIGVRLFGARPPAALAGEDAAMQRGTGPAARKKRAARSKTPRPAPARGRTQVSVPNDGAASWRLSPFRLLLYAAFSYLSLQATRNSHQFAAVVGSITAWNFGEWAAAIQRRRAALAAAGSSSRPAPESWTPRLVAAAAILGVHVWVGSGGFYAMTGEQRTIGLGEEPLWFPHAAARFAGRPEMPARFLSFHNGHASLFEYYHGPERKVFTDPRLEVNGADLFQRYQRLQDAMLKDEPGSSWRAELDAMGRPVILVDHEYMSPLGAKLLSSAHWRCVWFDAIAAVYVHDSATEAVRAHAVDFAARHFRRDGRGSSESADSPTGGLAESMASGKAMRNYVWSIPLGRGDVIRPLVWLGLDETRRVLRAEPESGDGWKLLGQIELARDQANQLDRGSAGLPSPRYRLDFDPVLDLSVVRATYALRRALDLGSGDFTTLAKLSEAYESRLMHEAQLNVLERMAGLRPINRPQQAMLAALASRRVELQRELGRSPATAWRNPGELDEVVTRLLAAGRAERAAELLEQAYPPGRAPWSLLDRAATLRLHLGEPARARALWQQAASVPDRAIAMARIAVTHLAEGDFEAARRAYRQALDARPGLFEACYGLAVLEQDAGDAPAAHALALKAVQVAPGDASRAAARQIAADVGRFAG